jgi:hypothetical protein
VNITENDLKRHFYENNQWDFSPAALLTPIDFGRNFVKWLQALQGTDASHMQSGLNEEKSKDYLFLKP